MATDKYDMPNWMQIDPYARLEQQQQSKDYVKGYTDGKRDSAKPPTPNYKPVYDIVADVLVYIKRNHYTFGAEKRMWDRLKDMLATRFMETDHGFNCTGFFERIYMNEGPSPTAPSQYDTYGAYDMPSVYTRIRTIRNGPPQQVPIGAAGGGGGGGAGGAGGPHLTATELARRTAQALAAGPVPAQGIHEEILNRFARLYDSVPAPTLEPVPAPTQAAPPAPEQAPISGPYHQLPNESYRDWCLRMGMTIR